MHAGKWPRLTGIYSVIDTAPYHSSWSGIRKGAQTTMEYTVKYRGNRAPSAAWPDVSYRSGEGVQIDQVSQGKKNKVP